VNEVDSATVHAGVPGGNVIHEEHRWSGSRPEVGTGSKDGWSGPETRLRREAPSDVVAGKGEEIFERRTVHDTNYLLL
jgi:hypothetical protein